jgi:hypothetical protein
MTTRRLFYVATAVKCSKELSEEVPVGVGGGGGGIATAPKPATSALPHNRIVTTLNTNGPTPHVTRRGHTASTT